MAKSKKDKRTNTALKTKDRVTQTQQFLLHQLQTR